MKQWTRTFNSLCTYVVCYFHIMNKFMDLWCLRAFRFLIELKHETLIFKKRTTLLLVLSLSLSFYLSFHLALSLWLSTAFVNCWLCFTARLQMSKYMCVWECVCGIGKTDFFFAFCANREKSAKKHPIED